MLTKRIIACLDVKNGRTVKGIQFENLIDMGDPVEQAKYYAENGIDELIFLDISATDERRKTLVPLVKKIAGVINIPFTVGGGINTVEDVRLLLENGADKISVNTAAVKDPNLINELAKQFGSQCVVVAVDSKFINEDSFVFLNGGKIPTTIKTVEWVKQAEKLGAGEILLTSIDHDGKRSGFAIDLTKKVSDSVNIPVIASGGAGDEEDFAEVFINGHADAALAAGIFHERILDVTTLKEFLKNKNIEVRL